MIMSVVDGYIFRTVTITALVALLVLVGVESFFTFLAELEDLGVGDYGLPEIARYMLLTLPRRTYQLFPMALLLGGLLGMGSLAAGSELVVMRAAGFSIQRLVLAALKAGLLLGLVALALGEFLAPPAERAAQTLRAGALEQGVAIREGRGFWARDGDLYVQVRSVLPGIRLADIHIYEVDADSRVHSVIRAEGARYAADGRWVLMGVTRTELGAGGVSTERLVELNVQSVIRPALMEVLAADPEDLSMRDLARYIRYLQANGLDASSHELAYWTKALGPLSNLVMLFVAMPFVFGSQRAGGVGQRLLVGTVLGVGFFLVNRMLGNVVLLYDWAPLLGAALPSLLFLAGGAYALSRLR